MPWIPIDKAVACGHGSTESWLRDHERGRAPTKLDRAGDLLVWIERHPNAPGGSAQHLRRIAELQRALEDERRGRDRERVRHAQALKTLRARIGVLRAAADSGRGNKRRAAQRS